MKREVAFTPEPGGVSVLAMNSRPSGPVLVPTFAGCKMQTELRRWDGIVYDSEKLMFKWNLSAQLGPAPFAGVILASI